MHGEKSPMTVDMFIKLEGIEGEAKDLNHQGEIDVLSWDWGMQHPSGSGIEYSRKRSRVELMDLSFMKPIDRSTPTLMLYCIDGKIIPTATITCRKVTGGKAMDYLVVTMTNAYIAQIATGATAQVAEIHEEISLKFEKINVRYIEQSSEGHGKRGEVEMDWSVLDNK